MLLQNYHAKLMGAFVEVNGGFVHKREKWGTPRPTRVSSVTDATKGLANQGQQRHGWKRLQGRLENQS